MQPSRSLVSWPCNSSRMPLRLPVLREGDLVRLVSPASYPEQEWLDESVEVLQSWALRVDVAPHAMDRFGFCAGRAEDRLADLTEASDPSGGGGSLGQDGRGAGG